MKNYKHSFIYGFAIFSMFFGSGNLVFPLQIGQQTEVHWLLGFFGLLITGILLPFLGLFVIKLHRGSYKAFFSEAGPIAGFALPLFTLSLLGPFGVVPRCITVAHGGMEYMFPQLSLGVFSFLFCLVCFVICLKDNVMITVLGKWMTPLLLGALGLLIVIGISSAPPIQETTTTGIHAFQYGFFIGYLPMDLFAAFFFSALIFNQLQAKLKTENHRDVLKAALVPSLIGSFLLALVYLGFVFLGAHYKGITSGVSPELIFPTIAAHLMGDKAVLFIGITVLFSCLTTAVALSNIYAHYVCTILGVTKKKFIWVVFGTMALSFTISLADFKGIAAILGPLLEVSYPSIIVLTLLSIGVRGHQKMKTLIFYGVLALSVGWRFWGI